VTPPHNSRTETTPIDDDKMVVLEETIRSLIGDDEVMVHFDVLVETRSGPDASRIRFTRFAPAGSDPLLSLGLMTAALSRLKKRLGLGDDG
jgi:hypothetical protein